jgi:TrmH family RNA methyltransferase
MQRTELVTSPANPLLRDVRKAVARGQLTDDGLWVAEGFHLFEEAARSNCPIPVVLVSESAQPKVNTRSRTVVLPDKLFASIAATETSQGVISLVRPPGTAEEQLFAGHTMIAVVDGLQDPGNAGAIVRAAEAFGATGVLFLKGSASPFHPKTLRASAGSLFRVPFVAGLDAAGAAALLRKHRLEVYAAMPFTGAEHLAEDTDFTRRCAIAVGNEGRGVSEELKAIAQSVAIPTAGVESLNAAVAAAILFYEMRRQRS